MADPVSWVGIGLTVLGGLFQAGSTIASGQADKAAAEQQAEISRQQQLNALAQQKNLDVQAGQERAASQRSAAEQRRQARLVQSRQQAVAAASGAGASDPTVVNLETQTAGEGEYRALAELYQGEERARYLESGGQQAAAQASIYGMERNAYRTSARNAGGIGRVIPTILDTGTTLFDRYGADWFGQNSAAPASGGFFQRTAAGYGYG